MATIKTIIYSEHLAGTEQRGWLERQDWESLREAVADALRDAHQDAEVEVEVRHHVSGVGAGTEVRDDDGCPLGYPEQDRAAAVADRAVERWLQSRPEESEPATTKPITVSGWYERTDGTVGYYQWIDGSARCLRTAADWAETAAVDARLEAAERDL